MAGAHRMHQLQKIFEWDQWFENVDARRCNLEDSDSILILKELGGKYQNLDQMQYDFEYYSEKILKYGPNIIWLWIYVWRNCENLVMLTKCSMIVKIILRKLWKSRHVDQMQYDCEYHFEKFVKISPLIKCCFPTIHCLFFWSWPPLGKPSPLVSLWGGHRSRPKNIEKYFGNFSG